MSEKIPNLDLIPNSLGHMVLDDDQIVQVFTNETNFSLIN